MRSAPMDPWLVESFVLAGRGSGKTTLSTAGYTTVLIRKLRTQQKMKEKEVWLILLLA